MVRKIREIRFRDTIGVCRCGLTVRLDVTSVHVYNAFHAFNGQASEMSNGFSDAIWRSMYRSAGCLSTVCLFAIMISIVIFLMSAREQPAHLHLDTSPTQFSSVQCSSKYYLIQASWRSINTLIL